MNKRESIDTLNETEKERILQVLNEFASASEELLSQLGLASHLMTPAIRDAFITLNNAMTNWHELSDMFPKVVVS